MEPFKPERMILIHGLEGSSQGDKAVLLRGIFPEMFTPDFEGSIEERLQLLYALLGQANGWTIVGSSLGGLMAALFTSAHPVQVRKQILLAPALFLPEFASNLPEQVDTPTVIFHGSEDTVVPLEETRKLAAKVFANLIFNVVDDDHRLFRTTQSLDWNELVL